MKPLRITGILLTATCVVGLGGAVPAMALSTNNPQWLVLASVLLVGQTAGVDAEANGVQKISFTGLTIECKKLSLAAGASLVGSKAPAPGTSEEIIRYSECEVAGFSQCKINGAVPGKIGTKLLRGLLVFLTELGALHEEASASGALLEPKVPNRFAEFHLLEANPGTSECPLTGVLPIEGTGLLVKNLTTQHLVTQEVEAPAVPKKAYFVNEGGVTKQNTGVKMEIGGVVATYTGKAKVLLASKEPWGIFN